MKIYTKTGDAGETGLLGGIRISKSHAVIRVCGDLDEVNSLIGLARSHTTLEDLDAVLSQVQNDLFDLGSRVAASLGETNKVPRFADDRASQLESWIDQFDAENPPLRVFVLPGGTLASSQLHVARAVCRRAERGLVEFGEAQPGVNLSSERIYLNRLSDLLFVLARLENTRSKHPETEWKVGGSS